MTTASSPAPAAVRSARRSGPKARLLPVFAVALIVAAPVVFVLASLGADGRDAQAHIWATTGPRYLAGTLLLGLFVGIGAAIVGAGTAFIVSIAEFPGRRIFAAALALPLAVPAYISAYAWADIFGPFGAAAEMGLAPVDIRSLPGAAFILTLSVYPYVFLAMRASFEGRTAALVEAARVLGARPVEAARRVLMPAGRAALAGGLALALMETAADFGVADYFGVPTLSVGIFRTWYGLGDLTAASQIAAMLFLVALLLTLAEQGARRGLDAESGRISRESRRLALSPGAAAAAIFVCAAPLALGFIAPVLVFSAKLGATAAASASWGLADAARNTGAIAAAGAAATLALAIFLALAARGRGGALKKTALRAATMGYALPGAVIAIGILSFAGLLKSWTGFALSGVALLVYAYAARFLTAGYNAVSGGLSQIHPLTDDAARMLGAGPAAVAARIHWPLARGAISAGALIVLVDIAKELPATLLLRPFNFETLATRVYRLASDERIAEAAPAALALIGISLAPVLWLSVVGRMRPPAAPASG